jgi:bacteriorhodopsin
MPELSSGQYSLVYNMLSFAVASMLGAFAFFVMAQKLVGLKYRASMVVSSVVVLIAGYHYFRIMGSWQEAHQLVNGVYTATGQPFNDAYRYVDWLLTVPLLLVELVLVLNLGKGRTGPMLTKLIIAAVFMIGLGYPGEVAADSGTRLLFGVLSTIPFVYILTVLWGQLSAATKDSPANVRNLFSLTRYLLVATWGFYPIAYALGNAEGTKTAMSVVGLQVGYSIADVAAKALYGVMIFAIAHAKSQADGSLPSLKEA